MLADGAVVTGVDELGAVDAVGVDDGFFTQLDNAARVARSVSETHV